MEAQVGKVRKTKWRYIEQALADERGDLANHAARNIEEHTSPLRELWDSLEELKINMEEHFSERHGSKATHSFAALEPKRLQAIEAAVETLEEVIDNLERAVEALDEIDFNW